VVFLIFFVYGVLLFSIQTSLLDTLALAGVTPDLVLIATVYCALKLPGNRGWWVGGLLGFVQDALSSGILGINTFSKSLLAYIFSLLRSKLMVEGVIPVFAFLFAASLFDGFVFFAIARMLFKNPPDPELFMGQLPLYAVYNAVLSPVLFWILNRNQRWWMRKLELSAS